MQIDDILHIMKRHQFTWTPLLRAGFLLYMLLVCSYSQADWFKDEQAIMGTIIRVELWHTDKGRAKLAINRVMGEMRRIDSMMSPYKTTSMLSQINREAANHPVGINQELFELIEKSLYFSTLTHGAFDITYASVGRFYNYRNRIYPTNSQINKNINKINYKHIYLNQKNHTISYALKGVFIDLGGIAKGYAVDRSIKLLKNMGIQNAIVTAGGDSRIIGDKRGRPWIIGIRDPRKARSVKGMIPLVDSALSTSGDYERYFIKDGEHYHHILNPKTGRSAKQLRSVTVIGPDATTTDALSTSVFVLGPVKGMALINRLPGIEAVLIDQQNKLIYSSGLLARGNQGKK